MARDLTKILNQLGDEQNPLRYQLLRNLSDLSQPELRQFQEAWARFSPERRVQLLRALVEMAEDHIEYHFVPIYVWALSDVDPRIRRLAIAGLWEEASLRLIPQFMRLLMEDEDAEVRAAAAQALGPFIYRSEIEEIPASAVADAIEMLWEIFHDPRQDIRVRRRALESLATSSRAGVARAIENARLHEDDSMRSSALFAMGRSADSRWTPHLLESLGDSLPSLRMEAARALGEIGSSAALNPLILMLDDEMDEDVRFAILEALGQIGGAKARQALQVAIDSDNEAEAEIAEWALEQLMLSGIDEDIETFISQVLGNEIEDDAFEDDADGWGDFYEDPIDAEIRRLLDDGDDVF